MTFCVNCETLKYNVSQLETMIATLDQENRQLHARNTRLQQELDNEIERRELYRNMSYAQIKEAFSK